VSQADGLSRIEVRRCVVSRRCGALKPEIMRVHAANYGRVRRCDDKRGTRELVEADRGPLLAGLAGRCGRSPHKGALVPQLQPGVPPCASDAISPRSRVTSRVSALAVGDTAHRWTSVPTGRDNGTGWLHSGIAASPTAVAATRLRSGTVGATTCGSISTPAFGGLKQSGIGREGLLPYLECETVLLDEASRSRCHWATGS